MFIQYYAGFIIIGSTMALVGLYIENKKGRMVNNDVMDVIINLIIMFPLLGRVLGWF